MCEKPMCSTLHMSNMSLAVQYGDDMPPSQCICECHLEEDSIHGNASRQYKKSMERK